MTQTRRTRRPLRAFAALAATSTLVLSACAEDGSGSNSAGGEGLDVGATKADYVAAFADLEPMTLRTQSSAPQGSPTAKNLEDYLAAVEEWSDGKITFDIAFSNAVAPPAEVDDALNDGRLDLGQVLPIYEPSVYPATRALIETGFISRQSPVIGALQSNAWPNEVAFNSQDVMDEWDDHGLVPMVPVFNGGSEGLFCGEPRTGLSEIAGAAVAAGGTAQSRQIEALGGSPASVPYTELFESLQRGVVGCAASNPTVSVLGGLLPEAPHVVIDPDAGFALAPGGLAFSKDSWGGLPLVAQQLLWDKLDVFIGGNIVDKIWPNTVAAAAGAKAAGGSIGPYASDAREALIAENEAILGEIENYDGISDGAALVSDAQAAADRWLTVVTDDLGYTDEVGYNDFDTWYSEDEADIEPFLSRLMDDVFAEHRPS